MRNSKLGVRSGMVALAVGAGVATFTIPTARRVGPKGKIIAVDIQSEVSGAGESHPRALPEPDVNVSIHPAPIIPSPYGTMPSSQCANNSGLLRATRRSH